MKPIINKKASWNYNLFEKFEAGIILNGNEIKSARVGKVSLDEAYVLIRDGDAVLLNSHIAPYEKGVGGPADPRRDRKLLLHKKAIKELDKIPDALAQKIYRELINLKQISYPRNSKKLSKFGC